MAMDVVIWFWGTTRRGEAPLLVPGLCEPDPKQSRKEGIAAAHRLCWWDL